MNKAQLEHLEFVRKYVMPQRIHVKSCDVENRKVFNDVPNNTFFYAHNIVSGEINLYFKKSDTLKCINFSNTGLTREFSPDTRIHSIPSSVEIHTAR